MIATTPDSAARASSDARDHPVGARARRRRARRRARWSSRGRRRARHTPGTRWRSRRQRWRRRRRRGARHARVHRNLLAWQRLRHASAVRTAMSPYSACVFVGASARPTAKPSAPASVGVGFRGFGVLHAPPRSVSARRTAAASRAAKRSPRAPPRPPRRAPRRRAQVGAHEGRAELAGGGAPALVLPAAAILQAARPREDAHLAAPVGRREAKALQREREVRLVDHLGRGRERRLAAEREPHREQEARQPAPAQVLAHVHPAQRRRVGLGAEQHVADAARAAGLGVVGVEEQLAARLVRIFVEREVDVARKFAVGVRAEPPARGVAPADFSQAAQARRRAVELAARARRRARLGAPPAAARARRAGRA